jgi:MFS family permease
LVRGKICAEKNRKRLDDFGGGFRPDDPRLGEFHAHPRFAANESGNGGNLISNQFGHHVVFGERRPIHPDFGLFVRPVYPEGGHRSFPHRLWFGGLLAGFAAAWFSAPYFWILAGRILQGIGAAGTSPVAMALAGDLFKGGEQSKVLGLMEAANGFGKVISPILGSLFALFVWYASFFAFPIFCLVSLLLFLVFVKERKRGKNAQSFGRYAKGLLSSFKTEGRWLFAAFLAGSVCLFTLFGILFYISEVLEKDYQIEGIRKGLILAIPLLFMTSTSYITGSKIGKKRTRMKASIVFGLFLMAASFTALISFQRLVPFFSVLAVSSIGTGLVLPCINSLITGSVPSARRGIVTALYGSVRFLGAAFGPPVYSSLMGMVAVRHVFGDRRLVPVCGASFPPLDTRKKACPLRAGEGDPL